MSRIIIGIHGVGNKPPQPLLQHWWQRAICEGLERSGHSLRHFKFDLAYWAHFLYSEPQDMRVKDPESSRYIENPYVSGPVDNQKAAPSQVRKKLLNVAEFIMEKAFMTENHIFNFDRIGDYVIRKNFRDLDLYYSEKNVELHQVGLYARGKIRESLATLLRKHRKKEILLISHSMGTIVAYDVLTQIVPDVKIHTFVTLGSPLGLPTVMKKIYSEQERDFKTEKDLPAPDNIEHSWLNFSDLNDHVALNYRLADEFRPNSHGVGPDDFVVVNDYAYDGRENHHKSFGYLRAPEFTQVICEFLSGEKRGPIEQIRDFVQRFLPRQRVNEMDLGVEDGE